MVHYQKHCACRLCNTSCAAFGLTDTITEKTKKKKKKSKKKEEEAPVEPAEPQEPEQPPQNANGIPAYGVSYTVYSTYICS